MQMTWYKTRKRIKCDMYCNPESCTLKDIMEGTMRSSPGKLEKG